MTYMLFRDDAYLQSAEGLVTAITPEGGIILDRSVFYPTSGGQAGDSGTIEQDGTPIKIATTVKGADGDIVLVPAEGAPLPAIGAPVIQRLDWDTRHRKMRIHTALHLLSVVIPLPVTGGAITDIKGRLDFNMPEALADKQAVEDALNTLIAQDHPVSESWITDAELDANPGLVKTMSVSPPRGTGRIRLIRIGTPAQQIDLQPCGGTHVKSTAEIGKIRLGKVEKKGKQNRRVNLFLTD